MSVRGILTVLLAFTGSILAVESAAPLGIGQSAPSNSDLSAVHWRFLGPVSYSGKINDVAVPGPKSGDRRAQGTVMYVVSATGGLFKTENAGTDWLPIFDHELVTAMHSVTIAPSNANIVWVGTGEPAPWPYPPVPGNGAYKSLDGGKSWRNVGLVATQYVARIAIHPTNPDIVFAATLGSLSQPSSDRGLYRTRDGGVSWERVLFVNDWTGVIDVAIDPIDPNLVYAVTHQRAQSPFGNVSYGPGSGVFKSFDGGSTWRRLSNGLPSTSLGRGAIALSPARHTTVYALLTVGDPRAGSTRGVSVFRSDDAGEHWRRGAAVIPDQYWHSTYFGRFTLDPSNVDRVYLARPALMVSRDGGETIEKILVPAAPGQQDLGGNMPDVHAIWVDPENSDHLVVGYDRGVRATVDGGKTWHHFTNIPSLQTWQVAIDRAEPFANVIVSTNDHSTISVPVRTRHVDGVTADDWINMMELEGVGVLSDANDATIVYAASLGIRRYDRLTQTTTSIGTDIPKETMHVLSPPVPLVSSPSRAGTMYVGFDRVMRSDDRGLHWRAVSPPLAQVVDSITLMGETVPVKVGGIAAEGQGITAISESPLDSNLVYAGTPDGVVHWTRNGGVTWSSNSEATDLPRLPVSCIVSSRAGTGVAYAAFDGANLGDFGAHVYRTTDFSAHWQLRVNGLPAGALVHALVEHPRNNELLFAATNRGVFVSVDAGANWKPLRNNMPGVAVWSIALEPKTNELVVATFGRGVWILDDITPLEEWAKSVRPGSDVLFPARPVVAFAEQPPRYESIGTPNPPYGATLFYYLGAQHVSGDAVEIEIVDQQGTVVHRARIDASPGLHEVTWNLRPDSWTNNLSRQFSDGVRPAPTGEYTVRLIARSTDGTISTRPLAPTVQLSVRSDPLRSDGK